MESIHPILEADSFLRSRCGRRASHILSPNLLFNRVPFSGKEWTRYYYRSSAGVSAFLLLLNKTKAL
jgi:hypothetical protein